MCCGVCVCVSGGRGLPIDLKICMMYVLYLDLCCFDSCPGQ